MDLGRSGGVGKDRNPLRARKRGFRCWARDVGTGWASGIRTVGRVAGVVSVGWLGKPAPGGSAPVRWSAGWMRAGWVVISIAAAGWMRAGWVVSAVVGWKTAGWVFIAAVSLAVAGWMTAGGWATVVSAVRWAGVIGMFSVVRLMFSGVRLMILGDGSFKLERQDLLGLEGRDFFPRVCHCVGIFSNVGIFSLDFPGSCILQSGLAGSASSKNLSVLAVVVRTRTSGLAFTALLASSARLASWLSAAFVSGFSRVCHCVGSFSNVGILSLAFPGSCISKSGLEGPASFLNQHRTQGFSRMCH